MLLIFFSIENGICNLVNNCLYTCIDSDYACVQLFKTYKDIKRKADNYLFEKGSHVIIDDFL